MKTLLKSFYDNLHYLLISFGAVLAPITPIILTLTILIFCDFIFGIYRAFKNGETITSRKMSNTLPKILMYNIVIVALYLSNTYILETGLPLEKIGAGLICLVELRSIDESWNIIFGWSLWDKVAKSLNRGKSNTKTGNQ